MPKKCHDERCLYYSEKSMPGRFETVTTETREGTGLWEKCSECNLVINRSGIPLAKTENYYNNEYRK